MVHFDLKLLRSFAAVASECSVTRAAERLHLTQPTVSGQIKELEQSLGFVLFHRTSRRVELSERGEKLLPVVQRILRDVEALRVEIEEMHIAKSRGFRLGAAMYTLDFEDRLALLDAFTATMPHLGFVVDNRLQCAQIADLIAERLDAALLLGITAPIDVGDMAGRSSDMVGIVNETVYPAGLERVILRRRPIQLLVPEESPLSGYDVIPQAAIEGERIAMLSLEHGEALINPIASFILRAKAIPMSLSEGNALAIERYAIRNRICAVGIGWFPTPGDMVLRPVEGMDFHLDLSLVLGAAPNKAARQFFAFASRWQEARDPEALLAPRPVHPDGSAEDSALGEALIHS